MFPKVLFKGQMIKILASLRQRYNLKEMKLEKATDNEV